MRMYTSKQQSRLVGKIPIGIKFDAWPKSDHGNGYMSPHHVENRQYIYIQYWAVIDSKKRHDCLSNLTWNTRWSSLGSCSMSPCGGGSWSSKGRFLKNFFWCTKFTSPLNVLCTPKNIFIIKPGPETNIFLCTSLSNFRRDMQCVYIKVQSSPVDPIFCSQYCHLLV